VVVAVTAPVTTVTPILTSGASEVVTLSLASVNSGLIKWVASGATLEKVPALISLGHLVISWKNQWFKQSPGQ